MFGLTSLYKQICLFYKEQYYLQMRFKNYLRSADITSTSHICLSKGTIISNDGNQEFCSIGNINISIAEIKIISDRGGRGK